MSRKQMSSKPEQYPGLLLYDSGSVDTAIFIFLFLTNSSRRLRQLASTQAGI